MNKNNFKSVYSMANTLYGVTLDEASFEDIAMVGWEMIGNKYTKLHRYTTSTENRRIALPCNVEVLEAVFTNVNDAQLTSSSHNYNDTWNQYVEDFVESWNINKNVFYEKGSLLKYRLEGDELVFNKDYSNVTILYHGIITDDEGLPYLNDKEVLALAAFCAYSTLYKKSIMLKDANLIQLAATIKADWLRLCNAARIPQHLTQNDMNDVLDVKVRWDRKQYGKAFKPLR